MPLNKLQLHSSNKATQTFLHELQQTSVMSTSILDTSFKYLLVLLHKPSEPSPQFFASTFHCNMGINQKTKTTKATRSSHWLHPKTTQDIALELLKSEFADGAHNYLQELCASNCFGFAIFGLTHTLEAECITACLFDVYEEGTYIHFIACSSSKQKFEKRGNIFKKNL